MNSKINKLFSFTLITALIGTTLHCNATNIVPANGENGNVAGPPSSPVTTAGSQNPSGGFSLQSMKSKITEIVNPKKDKIEPRATYSGTCGKNCSWVLDTSTGVLTISGTGAMNDYSGSSAVPWNSYKGYIKSININSGITYIGEWAFSQCIALTSVDIPDFVTSIGGYAFLGCSALSYVCYLGTKDPGKTSRDVFLSCPLDYVDVPKNYVDNEFCGEDVRKKSLSSSSSSSLASTSSSSEKSSSTGSSAVGKSSSSEKSGSTGASSASNKPVSGAVLSSKPAMWVIAAIVCVVPAVVFSFLM